MLSPDRQIVSEFSGIVGHPAGIQALLIRGVEKPLHTHTHPHMLKLGPGTQLYVILCLAF